MRSKIIFTFSFLLTICGFITSCKSNGINKKERYCFSRSNISRTYIFSEEDTLFMNLDIELPSGSTQYDGIMKRFLWNKIVDSGFVKRLSAKIDTMSLVTLSDYSVLYEFNKSGPGNNSIFSPFHNHIIYKDVIAKRIESGVPNITTYYISQKYKSYTRNNEEKILDTQGYYSIDNKSGLCLGFEDLIIPELRDSVLSLAISKIKIQIQSKYPNQIIDWTSKDLKIATAPFLVNRFVYVEDGYLKIYNMDAMLKVQDYILPDTMLFYDVRVPLVSTKLK